MFRASDIFRRAPGTALGTPTVRASEAGLPAKRPADDGPGGPVNRVWDPATGKFYDEDVPKDIQELMGLQKRPKVEHDAREELKQAWRNKPAKTAKVLGPSSVGLAPSTRAPPAPQQRSLGPGGEVDRTTPSVEYRGFSKVDMNERFFERAAVVINSRPTYWSGDGQFFIYWQGEVQRWSICDAASYGAAKAGQLPGWAYKDDHRHLCQAGGWMEAWGGEWRQPDLEVTFRSSSQHKPQWEDPVAQKCVTTVEFHGFVMKELNTRYVLRPNEVIQGKPSFWDASGVYFIYWQRTACRWAIADLKCLEAVRDGQCPGWAYRTDKGYLANARGWSESRNGEWVAAVLETAVINTSTRGLKVEFSGFMKRDLNTQFTERPDEEVQGKATLWDPSGSYFLYWQSSMRRWAVCDRASLQLAQSGLSPGWAYRKDAQHFTKANRWMEVWGREWKDSTVKCTLLEGVVKDNEPMVKSELCEDAGGTQFSAKQYRSLVRSIYERKKPAKLPELDAIFDRWVGRETTLFSEVCSKYGIDPDEAALELQPEEGSGDTGSGVAPGNEDPYEHLEEEDLQELKASEYAVLVQAVYEQHNPSKLSDLALLLRKYKARERELFMEVCKKYSVHPTKFHARFQDQDAGAGQMAQPA